eukprot:701726-Pelagomonas_calceolata.AAC.1
MTGATAFSQGRHSHHSSFRLAAQCKRVHISDLLHSFRLAVQCLQVHILDLLRSASRCTFQTCCAVPAGAHFRLLLRSASRRTFQTCCTVSDLLRSACGCTISDLLRSARL